jgi:hypothetical protein
MPQSNYRIKVGKLKKVKELYSIKIEFCKEIGGSAWESNPPNKNYCYVKLIYYAGNESQG